MYIHINIFNYLGWKLSDADAADNALNARRVNG